MSVSISILVKICMNAKIHITVGMNTPLDLSVLFINLMISIQNQAHYWLNLFIDHWFVNKQVCLNITSPPQRVFIHETGVPPYLQTCTQFSYTTLAVRDTFRWSVFVWRHVSHNYDLFWITHGTHVVAGFVLSSSSTYLPHTNTCAHKLSERYAKTYLQITFCYRQAQYLKP